MIDEPNWLKELEEILNNNTSSYYFVSFEKKQQPKPSEQGKGNHQSDTKPKPKSK